MHSELATSTPSKTSSAIWTNYAQGVAWGTVVLALGVIVSYVVMITAVATENISLTAGMVIASVILYLGFTVAHEAGHGNISHEAQWMKPFERTLGWLMNLLFIIVPFSLFAKIHDYHHAFTNEPDRDPDHWVTGDTWLAASWRAATLPVNYLVLSLTRFKNDPVIAETRTSSILYYTVTASVVIGLIAYGFAFELLIVGVLPIFISSFVLGMLFDWIPHTPNRHQGRYQNTRTYLFYGLNVLTLGQNYHHVHHLYPRVSWYHYKHVFTLIRSELEANNATIEHLHSANLPRFGKSLTAHEPINKGSAQKLTLTVERIETLTNNAVALTFKNLNDQPLSFKAGQYITVTKVILGRPITRCYSICESPAAGRLTIGVKRTDDGLLSNYLNNQLSVGDQLTVAGPFGDFVYQPDFNSENPLTLIAIGSGITPILAIAKCALETQKTKRVHLIYANRSIEETMFLTQIEHLSQAYPDQFQCSFIFRQPHKNWRGLTGRLDEKMLGALISKEFQEGLFYICGPATLSDTIVAYLKTQTIKPEHILTEAFQLPNPVSNGVTYPVHITFTNGEQHQLNVAENQTVLQAAMQQDIAIPHACGIGQCGCCMMQVTQGDSALATQDTPGILPQEQAQGFTLACQCKPKSALSLTLKPSH